VTTEGQHSDEQEIELIQEGRVELFELIVRRYTPVLYSLCYRMTGNREEAEDAVQEIFVKAYSSLDSFDPSRRFYSWLYTIAVNHLRSLNRKRERRGGSDIPYEDTVSEAVRKDEMSEAPDSAVVQREGERIAHEALSELEEKHREVFVLRMVEGLSGKETARILDIPENTVKTYLRRAKEKLIESMKKREWN